MFGGALFPDARSTWRLSSAGDGGSRSWLTTRNPTEDEPVEDREETPRVETVAKILSWFHAQKDFAEVAFVAVDKRDPFSVSGGVCCRAWCWAGRAAEASPACSASSSTARSLAAMAPNRGLLTQMAPLPWSSELR
jgi:hypothetical protein